MKGVFCRSDPPLYNQIQADREERLKEKRDQNGISRRERSDPHGASPTQLFIVSYCNWLWFQAIVQEGVNKSNHQIQTPLLSVTPIIRDYINNRLLIFKWLFKSFTEDGTKFYNIKRYAHLSVSLFTLSFRGRCLHRWCHGKDKQLPLACHMVRWPEAHRIVFAAKQFLPEGITSTDLSHFIGLLRHYATSRKVAASNPDEVDFFNWPNPFSRTMALGSTQPLTEVSTRKIPGG
jgi:hypothetical protein